MVYSALDLHHPVDHTGPFVVAPLYNLALGLQPPMLMGSALELEAERSPEIVLWYNQVGDPLVILVAPVPAHCLAMTASNLQACGLAASH